MRKHFASLYYATEDCLESVTVEFFSKSLISRDVKKSPSFYKIENEFVASLPCFGEDMTKLEEKCRNFVHCLAKAGGPAKDAAIALAEDWEREVLNKHSLKWSLKIDIETLTDLSLPSEILLSSEVPQKVQYLHDKFISVMKHIRTYYDECKQYKIKDFARYLTDDYEEPLTKEPLTNCESFDILLHSVKTHYSFFNFDLIEDLAKEFPLSDELQLELDRYVQELEQFKKSAALQQMKDAIKQVPIPHEASEVHCKIVIKLTGSWRKKTVKSLENLIQYLFERDSKRAKLIKIDEGSIIVTFLAFSRAQSFNKVQNRIQFIQYLGIFHIMINNEVIIDREEDVNFTFEDSLLYAINHIDSDAEYERVALLLIELKIELNYQNTDGQTPIMLASQGGHIEIFKSLLRNGANPFVKLPSNERYIGLSHLACIALSQHIYKSIGGERIIPRDDTSVEDMLEMAVNERGVSSHFYEPFMHVIENNLKEKFQWLQDCFHALNSSFLDAATNTLTSTALVTEAIQKFQSYMIYQSYAICENAHQLVQLLQSHYSCLNVDLLTIPCTITEPIKEQVEEYNTNLKMFKDTTSLLELAMMTKGMQFPDSVSCSKLILRLNKSWCSRTISELNKMENSYLLPFLNLIETHHDASSCTCTYFLPQLSQTEVLMAAVFEQRVSLLAIGVFEFMMDDIPIMMEDDNSSFTFEAALQEAHRTNNENILCFLLELNITLPIENDDTDLMIASRRGDFLTVQILLSKDPDINIQNNDGVTALMFASGSGHHQVVDLLLSKDPDINIQNDDGRTALMFASGSGHHQVVDLLLSKDPDINIQNNDGRTALMAASRYGHHQVVGLLLSKDPDINIQNNDGSTALMAASRNGHHQVVELLLSKDPDINIQNNDGWTALMAASRYGHHQVAELLLSKDPDINIQNNDGWTALIAASFEGHHQVVELLLSKDPDIIIQDKQGCSATTYVLLFSNFMIARSKIFAGVPLDKLTQLLDKLCSGNYVKILKLLLDSHPNNIPSFGGEKIHSLSLAALFINFDAIEILMEKCDITPEHINSAFTVACYPGHSSMIIHLSEKVTTLSNNERKLLVAAAEGDLGALISVIYEVGMSPDTPLVAGITPLMIAASCGHIELVDTLIQAGADVNKRNDEGMNALDILSDTVIYDRSDIKELLITNTPAVEPDPLSNNDETTKSTDPVSNDDETTNKKPTPVTAIKSILGIFNSFMKKEYNPYYSKQKELKIPHRVTDTPNSAMTSNMSQFVS